MSFVITLDYPYVFTHFKFLITDQKWMQEKQEAWKKQQVQNNIEADKTGPLNYYDKLPDKLNFSDFVLILAPRIRQVLEEEEEEIDDDQKNVVTEPDPNSLYLMNVIISCIMSPLLNY